jgi:hypothetical protein
LVVSQAFDPNQMILRFRERADAVKRRGFPPVEGPERLMFIEAAKIDFQDFAMLGDAVATLDIAPRNRFTSADELRQ